MALVRIRVRVRIRLRLRLRFRPRVRARARAKAGVRANQSMKQGRCSHSAPQAAAPLLQPKTSAKKLVACDRVSA
jgi:hypothetical protein